MKKLLIGVVLCVVVLGFAGQAIAIPITFTFEGTGTGNLDNTFFTDAAFTINVFAETDDVTATSPNVMKTANSLATIDISGIGSGVFSSGKHVFVNQSTNGLGFNDDVHYDLLNVHDPGFATYDLTTAFGPVFDPAPVAVYQFQNVLLDIGSLSFAEIWDVTFTATTRGDTPIPEPSTMLLLGFGLIGLLALGRKKMKK